MTTQDEKLILIARALDQYEGDELVRVTRSILSEPNVTEITVNDNGYGMLYVNGDASAVLPFYRLKEASPVEADAASRGALEAAEIQLTVKPLR